MQTAHKVISVDTDPKIAHYINAVLLSTVQHAALKIEKQSFQTENKKMKKTNIFYRTLALVILLASVLAIFASCEKDPPIVEENKDILDISGYKIVRFENSKPTVKRKTTSLKNTIKDYLGLDLSVEEDWYNPNTPPDPNAKEILIGETNRTESQNALAKIMTNDAEKKFVVEITENKIVIVGTDYGATLRAISYFINNYVMASSKGNNLNVAHGKSITRDYTVEKTISISNKLDIDVDIVSDVISDSSEKAHFPAVIELQYQSDEKNNGVLIASLTDENKAAKSMGCILKSTDEGKTWEVIFRPTDKYTPKVWAGSMAHIYELPEQIGNLPAGTLVYSANTVDYNSYSHIGVWVSTDCGKSWREIAKVATGGGLEEGVWEPYMLAHEGYLYCFYSDDSHPRYDQRIVYKRSKNGINWEAAVPVCAFGEFTDRPGMPVVTKLGNGEFFLVYEYVREGNASVVHYKKTKDITDWNASDPGTAVMAKKGSASYFPAVGPSCVWTPAGGNKGTLFVTGQLQIGGVSENCIFVSLDYGSTWDIIENPLSYMPYDTLVDGAMAGYRPIMVLGSDPTVIHYVNTIQAPNSTSIVQYAKLKVYE